MVRVAKPKKKERGANNGRTFSNVSHPSAHFSTRLAFIQVLTILEVVSLGLKMNAGVSLLLENVRGGMGCG